MGIKLKKFFKDYRDSFVHLIGTIILFSNSFTSYDNPIPVTLSFLLIVNLTCFSNQYLVLKYYEKNPDKKSSSNKGYALFIMFQTLFTLLIFIIYKI